MNRDFTAYTERYMELAFQTYYSAGRPSYKKLCDLMYEKKIFDERGRVPSDHVLKNWASEYGWSARCDALDAEAARKMEIVLVDETVSMWKRHADAAREVALSALEYVREHGFDTSSSAIQAIKWAQEEERKTRGAEEFISAIKDKSSEDLMETIRELMERSAANEIVEGETKEDREDKEE